MRKSLLQLLLYCLVAPAALWAQSPDDLKSGRQTFQLPEGMTSADYWPGKVMFKVREELRPYCSANRIDIPVFSRYLSAIRASALTLSFPNAARPSEPVNALGQRLADLSLIYELDYTAQADIENAVNLLLETGIVEYAEPSYIYKSFYNPADPDTTGQYYLSIIHAREAWDLEHGDSSVVIGIIDTGTSYLHPDLGSKIQINYADPVDGLDNDGNGHIDDWRGWDFGGDWGSLGDNDCHWVGSTSGSDHGVLVGGAAAAATDNGINIASLGFNCRILPVKVSIDNTPLIYRGYQGIVYAADMGVDIMNLSWGGGDSECRMCQEAIRYATINKDVLVVAAAGNTPGSINFYPASYPLVLSVPGTMANDAFWIDAPNFGSTRSYFCDVAAPSQNIVTTTGDAGLYAATGTSLGSPITCGVAGLVRHHFPNLNNQQVGQMVRMGSDANIYSLNTAIYTEKMGHGRVDALGALTYTGPAVRAVEVDYDPGPDGLIQAGDTVWVRARFANYLNTVQNLEIDLSTPSFAQISILRGNVGVGTLGTLDTISNWMAPFRIVINATATAGTLTYLRFGYAGTGYTDYEYFPLKIQPTYINVDANRIETSMDGKGRWGATNFPSLSNGLGLVVDQNGLMNDAGFMIGKDASHVSNNFENQTGNAADNHFTNLVPISRTLDGQLADLEAYTRYSDAGAGGNAIGVTVDQHTYQWDMPGDDNYIIQEYTIHNPTNAAMTGLYAGMYYDLDGFWRTNNVSQYDSASRCIYDSTETYVFLWEVGVSLLTPDSLRGYACSTATWGYTQADKWTALTSPPQNAVVRHTNVAQFTGAGPFNIAPGDSHIVAFAILAGDSLEHLRTSRQAAYDKYWCVVRGGMNPQADLGPDILHCGNTAPVTLDAGPGQNSYLWNTGATTQTIVATTGDYWVKTTNANGCDDYDRINVTLNPGITSAFTASAGPHLVGDPITFTSTTPNSLEWGWYFDDGTNLCLINNSVQHVFTTPGIHEVCLGVGNNICFDTTCISVTVDTLVGRLDPVGMGFLQAFPIPTSDRLQVKLQDEAFGQVTLTVFDIAGRRLHGWSMDKNSTQLDATIDLADLPAGVYMLQVRDALHNYSKRILVE